MNSIHLPTAKKRSWALQLTKLPDLRFAAKLGRPDPRDFLRDVLGVRPTQAALKHGYTDGWSPGQEEILLSVRDHKGTLVQSGRGTGKTRDAAWAALWFLYSFEPSMVVTTAPTMRQVAESLWKEIHTAHSSSVTPLPGRRLFTKLEVARDWYAIGFTVGERVGDLTATAFQSFHAPHVLVIVDEAVGVSEEVLAAAQGIAMRPTDRILVLANPTDPGSWVKHASESALWHRIRLDCRDHPNVLHDDPEIIPGAVTREWIADRLEEYGSEEAGLYKALVCGLWPEQSEDALIRAEWVAKAQRRWTDLAEKKGKPDGRGAALGLDIAGEGSDLTVLSKLEDSIWEVPLVAGKRAWHVGRDITHATDLVIAAIEQYPTVRSLTLDDSGLGAGVSADLMKRQRDGKLPKFLINPDPRAPGAIRSLRVERVNFGAQAWADQQFDLAKDELWWMTREALRKGQLALPPQDELNSWRLPKGNDPIAQLTTPIYAAPRGKIMVYDKRSSAARIDSPELVRRIRALPTKSPDVAHSLLLAVAGWLQLKPQTVYAPPKTAEEMFQQRTRELAQRGRRGFKDPKKAGTPWQRMR